MDDSFTIVHNLLQFFPLVFDDVEGALEVSVEAPEKQHFNNITLVVFKITFQKYDFDHFQNL